MLICSIEQLFDLESGGFLSLLDRLTSS